MVCRACSSVRTHWTTPSAAATSPSPSGSACGVSEEPGAPGGQQQRSDRAHVPPQRGAAASHSAATNHGGALRQRTLIGCHPDGTARGAHLQHPVGHRVEPRRHGLRQRRGAPARADPAISAEHGLDLLRVEMCGRLVGEEERGVADQRACEGDALLLSTGELAGPLPACAPVDISSSSPMAARRAAAEPHPGEDERGHHVLQRREAGNEVERLEDHADRAPPVFAAGRDPPVRRRRSRRRRPCRCVGFSRPASTDSNVVLPHPTGPSASTIWPPRRKGQVVERAGAVRPEGVLDSEVARRRRSADCDPPWILSVECATAHED